METWISLIVAVIGALSAIWSGKVAWNKDRAIRATATAIEAFKGAMAQADDPDTAKLLTRSIGTALEQAGPAVKAAHEATLARAGMNVAAILGPAIARLARPEPRQHE